MDRPATTYTGPLGSRIHVLRADPGTVVELAAVDWSASFRRVCLDPVRGLVTLMIPSHLHEASPTSWTTSSPPPPAPSPADGKAGKRWKS